MLHATTFLPVLQVDTSDSLLEASTRGKENGKEKNADDTVQKVYGQHEADQKKTRGIENADDTKQIADDTKQKCGMKTYGICGSPRVPIL
ncbi:hypothetical protein T4A_12283 [Trichinella pseudospiralis]|uniref:Uncharacterized protein n=1 Tax=Trichinella pseudospiralis TaxID=6337 RepID=A0A0V1EPY6_TRIPS|nr:hypothetical protein T4A_12283 [Trichinella pseudospiralis]